MNAAFGRLAWLLAALLPLIATGCDTWWGGSDEPKLKGERIAVLTRVSVLEPDSRIADLDVRIPRPDVNASWPQDGGLPNHAMHHLAASGPLKQLWRTSIGDGSDSEAQLLAQPVIADGRVITIDIDARIRVTDADTGREIWSRELSKDDDNEGILGGGLAYYEGRIYATTGFAQVIALDAKSGREIWRKTLTGPLRAAPTVRAGRVFAVTVTNETYALDADDGRQIWTHAGLVEVAGLVGGGAPAVDAGVVVVPYSSGEVVALRVENGRVVWTETLTALRRSDAVTAIAHIRGRPVIDRGIVYIVGHSDRTVAVDLRTGTRLWEVRVGGRFHLRRHRRCRAGLPDPARRPHPVGDAASALRGRRGSGGPDPVGRAGSCRRPSPGREQHGRSVVGFALYRKGPRPYRGAGSGADLPLGGEGDAVPADRRRRPHRVALRRGPA